MKLTFIYQSVTDLPAAVAFYRDKLGLAEAWREGDSTVAFVLPGTEIQLMLDVKPDDSRRWNSGGFFAVDDVDAFVKEHQDAEWVGEAMDMPGGKTASFADPSGNVLHVFDQSAETDA